MVILYHTLVTRQSQNEKSRFFQLPKYDLFFCAFYINKSDFSVKQTICSHFLPLKRQLLQKIVTKKSGTEESSAPDHTLYFL